jgi:hypothetical protein
VGITCNSLWDGPVMYKDLDTLSVAMIEVDLKDEHAVDKLRVLVGVYFDALYDPPEGVIGVGAITYAEYKLIEAQGGV